MTLECIKPFGRWKRGDKYEVANGVIFDACHWRLVTAEDDPRRESSHHWVVEITPEEALMLIENRDGGPRPGEDDPRVQAYRAAMNAGEWEPTSHIHFYGARLRDGRHRMVALSRANGPQSFRIPHDQYPNWLAATGRPPHGTRGTS